MAANKGLLWLRPGVQRLGVQRYAEAGCTEVRHAEAGHAEAGRAEMCRGQVCRGQVCRGWACRDVQRPGMHRPGVQGRESVGWGGAASGRPAQERREGSHRPCRLWALVQCLWGRGDTWGRPLGWTKEEEGTVGGGGTRPWLSCGGVLGVASCAPGSV